jgi:Tfp pilus assembly protein PilF
MNPLGIVSRPRPVRVGSRSLVLLTLLVAPLLWLAVGCRPSATSGGGADEFARLMNVGKNYYDKGEAARAIGPFQKAVALNPGNLDGQLNLANALLLGGDATNALSHALEATKLDPNVAAAHYVAGCAHLRLRQFEPAVKALQIARDLDPKVGAVTFHLARAHRELGHLEEAIALLQELTSFETNHVAGLYLLSQSLIRAGRQAEASGVLERYTAAAGPRPGGSDEAKLERCVYTQARAPFILEQPPVAGLKVAFADVTGTVLPNATNYHGPIAVIDYHHDGRNSLFVGEGRQGFRLLDNTGGRFAPRGSPLPGVAGATYRRCLVADLQNDRFEDVLVLGDPVSHAFKFATNAQVTDATAFAQLKNVAATDGVLLDLDFTGKLDLLAISPTNRTPRVLRNLGLYFTDKTATSGVPASLTGATQIAIEDWNDDDLLDVFVARQSQPPQLLLKQRGGPLVAANSPTDWPAGGAIAVGDFNNDVRADLVIAAPDHVELVFHGLTNRARIPTGNATITELFPLDYDNDGWLDLIAVGDGLRAWRNAGAAGFPETTAALGLDKVAGAVESIAAADFDVDGDTDLAVAIAGQGLKVLQNDGGHANLQVKVRLVGNKSNFSGLGTRVEINSGGLRLGRRVASLPIEIGVGQHPQLESLNARWLNLSLNNVDVKVEPKSTLPLLELSIPDGSCPYLYAWDGQRFRFVTDLLGAAPLGLHVSDTHLVEADPDEYVWLGDEAAFPPRDGQYVLQITEELREVLYLDTAELVAVDYVPGTEVHTTGKMVPGRPFPPHELITLHQPHPLRHAVRSDGLDVTQSLQVTDGTHASPIRLRIPQLRGLAEPWNVTLDFGPLPVERPLVLALTGWIRFGGGMANVGASHNPDLPFPFPTLEVETAAREWKPVDVVVGTPAGKTKSIAVDLTGKLPAGSQRLRLATAYEIHWDRIALLEKVAEPTTRITRLLPATTDLHYRGYSEFEDLPWYLPLTPDYTRVSPNPKWRIVPTGWCTRYGDVRELVERRDNALVLVNGGDELTLSFAADRLPPKPAGAQRGFFLFSSGWDKDSDFHCEKGWQVEPLPWHGLDDQLYGQQPRPAFDNDGWIRRYNTRWVGPLALRRSTAR